MPIVVNVPGSESMKCTCCKTWLDHWKKHSKKSNPGKCRACGKAKAIVGGLVKRFINYKGKLFVIPMCEECSSIGEQMDSFLVKQEDFIYAGACFEDLDDISDTNDADTEFHGS